MRRWSPQIAQVATPVDGSSRRRVAHPLVEQKRGWAAAARRRRRRMAWARIGALAAVDRESIEEITLVVDRSNEPGKVGRSGLVDGLARRGSKGSDALTCDAARALTSRGSPRTSVLSNGQRSRRLSAARILPPAALGQADGGRARLAPLGRPRWSGAARIRRGTWRISAPVVFDGIWSRSGSWNVMKRARAGGSRPPKRPIRARISTQHYVH